MFGMDYLFGAAYPKMILKAHRPGWAAGFFHGFYRDRTGKVLQRPSPINLMKKLGEKGQCSHFRVQLLWDDNHNFYESDITIAVKFAKLYEKLSQQLGDKVVIELSPFCEHNIKQMDAVLNILSAAAPSCVPVNNPYKGGLSTKYKNEVHGNDRVPKRKYNYSFDGLSAVDADVESMKEKHRNADVFFFWVPQYNMRKTLHDPTKREDRKVKPGTVLIESLFALAEDRGPVALPRDDLWKSHADQGSQVIPRGRDCKPVFLTPRVYKSVRLINKRTGRIRARLTQTGKLGDRFLWRSDEWGFKIWTGHVKNFVLQADGKVIGEVNPAFRAGSFR